MRIAYYCQHVLGVGHFHRSLEICRKCAATHDVTMIVGGPELPEKDSSVIFMQLPALRMNDQFKNLEPCETNRSLDDVKEERRRTLLHFIDTYEPDCLIIELYPFGRKAFRFELDPLLEILCSSEKKCRIYCSLRDILVEKKEGRDKFEQRAVDTLNRSFDGLLIHADRRIISLEQTFSKSEQIDIPVFYTGFITPKPAPDARRTLREHQGIDIRQKLIVASIGGGSVGSELLYSTIEATRLLNKQGNNIVLQVFTGPYFNDQDYQNLCRLTDERISVSHFTNNFIDWLSAADLSVSMAGYNTSMNTIAAGVPSLMYPFSQNREQRLRIDMIGAHESRLLEPEDLEPKKLAAHILAALKRKIPDSDIDLNGAEQTVKIIENEAAR